MAHVLLFHHALGLTPGVHAFADNLRGAGHRVDTPDLFEGRTFGTIPKGLEYVESIGFETVIDRGVKAALELPSAIVYAGMSLGVLSAQKLAQTRAGARGALFLYSCVPPEAFGCPWTADVPVQIHGMDQDPYFVDEADIEAARAVVASANQGELFLYSGDQHYFADPTQPAYHPDAAKLLTERVLNFLAALEA